MTTAPALNFSENIDDTKEKLQYSTAANHAMVDEFNQFVEDSAQSSNEGETVLKAFKSTQKMETPSSDVATVKVSLPINPIVTPTESYHIASHSNVTKLEEMTQTVKFNSENDFGSFESRSSKVERFDSGRIVAPSSARNVDKNSPSYLSHFITDNLLAVTGRTTSEPTLETELITGNQFETTLTLPVAQALFQLSTSIIKDSSNLLSDAAIQETTVTKTSHGAGFGWGFRRRRTVPTYLEEGSNLFAGNFSLKSSLIGNEYLNDTLSSSGLDLHKKEKTTESALSPKGVHSEKIVADASLDGSNVFSKSSATSIPTTEVTRDGSELATPVHQGWRNKWYERLPTKPRKPQFVRISTNDQSLLKLRDNSPSAMIPKISPPLRAHEIDNLLKRLGKVSSAVFTMT